MRRKWFHVPVITDDLLDDDVARHEMLTTIARDFAATLPGVVPGTVSDIVITVPHPDEQLGLLKKVDGETRVLVTGYAEVRE